MTGITIVESLIGAHLFEIFSLTDGVLRLRKIELTNACSTSMNNVRKRPHIHLVHCFVIYVGGRSFDRSVCVFFRRWIPVQFLLIANKMLYSVS